MYHGGIDNMYHGDMLCVFIVKAYMYLLLILFEDFQRVFILSIRFSCELIWPCDIISVCQNS